MPPISARMLRMSWMRSLLKWPDRMLTIVIITIVIALIYDFLNGMNDAANSIATIVSTKVLPPGVAVVWAALFNFSAVFFLGVNVANTIGKGIIHAEYVDSYLI